MSDEPTNTIRGAQNAPTEDHMLWAEMASGTEIPIQTVRLPLGIESETAMTRIHGEARRTLRELGFSEEESASAQLHLDRLPSAEEARALLDPLVERGEEFVLLDFPWWETVRVRLHLTPRPSEFGSELEMDYRGLIIGRSGAS